MRYKLTFRNLARLSETLVLVFTDDIEAGMAQDDLEKNDWEIIGYEVWGVNRKVLISVG